MSLAWFLPLPGSYAGVDEVGVYNFACSLHEVLAKHPFLPHGCGLFSGSYFPSFSEGLSLRLQHSATGKVPFECDFPSFSEGLSLRHSLPVTIHGLFLDFPSFSEGLSLRHGAWGTATVTRWNFPSFSEGLSLRPDHVQLLDEHGEISLPFRRDFH